MRRIAVFLNGSRGQAVLSTLLEAGHEVAVAIVPARSKELVAGTGIPVMVVGNVNASAVLAELKTFNPTIAIVAGFSSIFHLDLITLPELGALNLHAGRLPQYRGGSPLNWQMIQGENPVGISVVRMDAGIDTGDILAEADIEVGPRDTISDLHARANMLFPQMVLRVLSDMEAGRWLGRPQQAGQACYWHQRSDADGCVDWVRWTAARVDRFVRALTRPYPGAWSSIAGQRVRIFASEIPELRLTGTAGRICYIQKQGPFVVCADRAILVTTYAVEGEPDARLRHGDIFD
jgi:methionyl-tRNA formyltransferase